MLLYPLFYLASIKDKGEREENQILMELMDKKYQHGPTYGARRMQKYLLKRYGYKVNLKRVRRLMKRWGLEYLHPKRLLFPWIRAIPTL